MCWTCGGTLAANLKCDHGNPDPERLAAAHARAELESSQVLECPDCGGEIRVVVDHGVVRIVGSTHRV